MQHLDLEPISDAERDSFADAFGLNSTFTQTLAPMVFCRQSSRGGSRARSLYLISQAVYDHCFQRLKGQQGGAALRKTRLRQVWAGMKIAGILTYVCIGLHLANSWVFFFPSFFSAPRERAQIWGMATPTSGLERPPELLRSSPLAARNTARKGRLPAARAERPASHWHPSAGERAVSKRLRSAGHTRDVHMLLSSRSWGGGASFLLRSKDRQGLGCRAQSCPARLGALGKVFRQAAPRQAPQTPLIDWRNDYYLVVNSTVQLLSQGK